MQEYFTIEEVARLLGYSKEAVFEVMQPGRPGATLSPAYVVEYPLDAKDRTTGIPCKVPPGVYEIGVFPVNTHIDGNRVNMRVFEWGDNDLAYVNELTCYEEYKQPYHISIGLFPTDGSNKRRILAYARPDIVMGYEKLATADELSFSRPKNWMDGFTSEDLAPIEGNGEGDHKPLVAWEDFDGESDASADTEEDHCHGFILWHGGLLRVSSYVLVGDPIIVARGQVVILPWMLNYFMMENGKRFPGELREVAADRLQCEVVRPITTKKKTTGKRGKDPFSLMTTIDACLQAFCEDKKRKPGGKSAIGELVGFIAEQHKSRTDESAVVFKKNILELRAQERRKKERFICLRTKICNKYPKGQRWHPWGAFDNQFREAMKKFTPEAPPTEKYNP